MLTRHPFLPGTGLPLRINLGYLEYQITSPVQFRIPILKSLKPNCASREFRAQVIGPLKKIVE